MKILNIAFKDLQIFFKDRGSALQLFVLPLVFIFVFSGLGSVGQDEDVAVPLPVVNLDDGEAAQKLIENIDKAGGVQTELMEQSDAETKLEAGDIDWLLTVPEDFTANLTANTPVDLVLTSHPDADDTEREAVRLVVDGVAQGMTLQTQILASLQFMGEMQAGNAPEQQAFTTERILGQAEEQFETSEERPLITVQTVRPGQIGKAEEPEPLSGTQVSVPGFTVLFVFVSAGSTALSIYREKQIGSFRRLMAAPMSKAELLLGKMVPGFIIALIQVVVIFAVGMLILPLLGLDGLTLGDHPFAVILIVLAMALCATGMGVLIAAFAKTEGQIGGGSAVLLWLMGALGGAFFPTYLLEGFLGQIGQVVPQYWASKAFYGVLVRGQDVNGIITEVAILLGFTLLFWVVGVWQFDFD